MNQSYFRIVAEIKQNSNYSLVLTGKVKTPVPKFALTRLNVAAAKPCFKSFSLSTDSDDSIAAESRTVRTFLFRIFSNCIGFNISWAGGMIEFLVGTGTDTRASAHAIDSSATDRIILAIVVGVTMMNPNNCMWGVWLHLFCLEILDIADTFWKLKKLEIKKMSINFDWFGFLPPPSPRPPGPPWKKHK